MRRGESRVESKELGVDRLVMPGRTRWGIGARGISMRPTNHSRSLPLRGERTPLAVGSPEPFQPSSNELYAPSSPSIPGSIESPGFGFFSSREEAGFESVGGSSARSSSRIDSGTGKSSSS